MALHWPQVYLMGLRVPLLLPLLLAAAAKSGEEAKNPTTISKEKSNRKPWAVGRGPWAVGRGPWAVGRGPWAVGRGRKLMEGCYAFNQT